MALFGNTKTSSSNKTYNTEQSTANNNVGTANTYAISGLGAGEKSVVNLTLTDQGAVDKSLSFAGDTFDKSVSFAKDVYDKASSGFATTQEALQNAYNQSLSLVSRASAPADEKTREQFSTLTKWVIGGLVIAAAAWAYRSGK